MYNQLVEFCKINNLELSKPIEELIKLELDNLLSEAIYLGDIHIVRYLVRKGARLPKLETNDGLISLNNCKKFHMIQCLTDLGASYQAAFKAVYREKHLEVIKLYKSLDVQIQEDI